VTNRLPAALLAILLASPALAQDPAAPAASNPADYRWAIYTSCTVAFVAIAAYLVMTHGRAAKVSEEVAAVERRLDELEKGAK
jgi:bacteriorhodopsin